MKGFKEITPESLHALLEARQHWAAMVEVDDGPVLRSMFSGEMFLRASGIKYERSGVSFLDPATCPAVPTFIAIFMIEKSRLSHDQFVILARLFTGRADVEVNGLEIVLPGCLLRRLSRSQAAKRKGGDANRASREEFMSDDDLCNFGGPAFPVNHLHFSEDGKLWHLFT